MMQQKISRISAIVFGAAFPVVASAAALDIIVNNIGVTLRSIIGLLFIIATIVFLWGVIRYISKTGDEKARGEARSLMMWGIIGLAVMAAAWGVANILIDYFLGPGRTGPGFTPPPQIR